MEGWGREKQSVLVRQYRRATNICLATNPRIKSQVTLHVQSENSVKEALFLPKVCYFS